MTSLEIVQYINDERQRVEDAGGKRYVELSHSDFLKKVPKVLSEGTCGKFFSLTFKCLFPTVQFASRQRTSSLNVKHRSWR